MKRKYTRELLEPHVKECVSVAGVLRKLGLPLAGGSHAHLSRKLKEFQLDTSHFRGLATNAGETHKGPEQIPHHQVLVLRTHGYRQHAYRLRRALIETGRAYRCEAAGCSVAGEWRGKL